MAGLGSIVISKWMWISLPYSVTVFSGKPLVAKQFWRRVSSLRQLKGLCTIRFLEAEGPWRNQETRCCSVFERVYDYSNAYNLSGRPLCTLGLRLNKDKARHQKRFMMICSWLMLIWKNWVAPNPKGAQVSQSLLSHSLTCDTKIWQSLITYSPGYSWWLETSPMKLNYVIIHTW
jgi:hypothetical protein